MMHYLMICLIGVTPPHTVIPITNFGSRSFRCSVHAIYGIKFLLKSAHRRPLTPLNATNKNNSASFLPLGHLLTRASDSFYG